MRFPEILVEQSIPLEERFEVLGQRHDALVQAVIDVDQKGWDEVYRLAYDLDSSCQLIHFDLAAQRRADPPLHAECVKFIERFLGLLISILQSDDIPTQIRDKLQHYSANAQSRADLVRAMDREKVELDTEFGLPIRTRLKKALTP